MEDLTDRKWRQRFRSALVVSRKQKQELGESKERNNTIRDLNYEVTVALPVEKRPLYNTTLCSPH